MESIELEEISTGKKSKKMCPTIFRNVTISPTVGHQGPTIYILHTYCKKKCVQLFSEMSPFPPGYGSPGDLHTVRKKVFRIALFASCVGGQGLKFFKKNCVQLFSESHHFMMGRSIKTYTPYKKEFYILG